MIDLARQHRAGELELFAGPPQARPAARGGPAKAGPRGRVIEPRRRGLSA